MKLHTFFVILCNSCRVHFSTRCVLVFQYFCIFGVLTNVARVLTTCLQLKHTDSSILIDLYTFKVLQVC